MNEDDWDSAALLAARARAQTERVGLGEYPTIAIVFAASAAANAHFGRLGACEHDTRQATRLLAKLTDFTPWYKAECSIALAWAALRLGDLGGAQDLLKAAERELRVLPEGNTGRTWLRACRAQAELVAAARNSEADPLTTAELRVLQFLPTHLSFPEIALELFVSTNTVKTHARAVYRKLAASCRTEAVTNARETGLLTEST
jgi:LuxR family maltose regulon positive regulatory protein